MWSVTVHGTPAPKGTLKCVGQNGRHQLVEQDRTKIGKPWRRLIAQAGEAVAARAGDSLTGPVSVEATFTLDRPGSAGTRLWPWRRTRQHNADVDKLARMLLDGLTDGKVWGDDMQVVELNVRKTYPDNPDCPDALPSSGAVIRIWRTELPE